MNNENKKEERREKIKDLMNTKWDDNAIKMENSFSNYSNDSQNISYASKIFDNYMKSVESKEMSFNDIALRKQLLKNTYDKSLLKDESKEVKDSYTNPSAGYGYGTEAPQEGSGYTPSRHLTRNFINLNQVYRTDAIFAKIIDTHASEMFKNGLEVDTELGTDTTAELEESYEELVPELEKAVKYSDLYGLTVVMPFIKGKFNETALKRPLDFDDIDKGDFQGIKTLTKWQGCMPLMEKLVERPSKHIKADEIGEPLYFDVWFSSSGKHYKVHRSWLMVFITNDLPGIEKDIEQRSGVSSFERLDLPLKNYNSTLNYILSLLQMSTQRVLKLEGLNGFEQMSEVAQDNFKKRMGQISKSTRLWNVLVLGEEDEYEYKAANFAGLKELVTVAQENLAASSSMPMNKLFGKSPSGLNNSSMENLTDFYDFIEKRQKNILKPNLKKLFYILYRHLFGDSPKNGKVRFKFKSLWSLNEQDKALILERKSRSVEKAFMNNSITIKEYLEELKELGRVTDAFTNITDATFSKLDSAGISDFRYQDFLENRVQRNEIVEEKDLKDQVQQDLTKDEIKDIYNLVKKTEKKHKGVRNEIV